MKAAEAVLDRDDPRTWYYALMDYGAWLKKREPNPSRKAAAYSRQSSFKGSLRQARGAVLRSLGMPAGRASAARGANAPKSLGDIAAESGISYELLSEAAAALSRDGLVLLESGSVRFAE
jgi:A/G-specific adenine glycosylase